MRIFLLVLAAVSAVGVQMSGAESAPKVDFSRDIRPILTDRCLHCHGPDAATRKGGLAARHRGRGEEGGHRPGNPDTSELLARMTTAGSRREDAPRGVPEARAHPGRGRNLVRSLDRAGRRVAEATGPSPPSQQPAPPAVADAAWPINDIDRFVLARLEKEGLEALGGG
jgi:hypothetical protein